MRPAARPDSGRAALFITLSPSVHPWSRLATHIQKAQCYNQEIEHVIALARTTANVVTLSAVGREDEMHTNGSGPTFSIGQLKTVSITGPILVAGYQADTSNSIELHAEPGTSPVSRVIHRMMEQPLDVSMLQAHPAGQMASAYTHFTNLDTHDPLYRFTMGMRVSAGDTLPQDVGMVEVPPGDFLSLEVPGPFHTTIPAAWTWLLAQFADNTIPYVRTFAGDVELYTFGPEADDSICTIYVAVERVA